METLQPNLPSNSHSRERHRPPDRLPLISSCITQQIAPRLLNPNLPSHAPTAITTHLKAAGNIVGIELLDHIIFNRTSYWSFLAQEKL